MESSIYGFKEETKVSYFLALSVAIYQSFLRVARVYGNALDEDPQLLGYYQAMVASN